MDEELLELQRQFESAQQAKSNISLSERNVVELVQKLQQLQIIDFDLLHNVSDKMESAWTNMRNGNGTIIILNRDVNGFDKRYLTKRIRILKSPLSRRHRGLFLCNALQPAHHIRSGTSLLALFLEMGISKKGSEAVLETYPCLSLAPF